jgi:hypothetical protein
MTFDTGQQSITYYVQNCGNAAVTFTIKCSLTDQAREQWVASVWGALYNAAQTAFYAQQQSVNAQISALQDQINNVDTLTLRREENDEILKSVLRWILGPTFDFMPKEVGALFGTPPSGGICVNGGPRCCHFGGTTKKEVDDDDGSSLPGLKSSS